MAHLALSAADVAVVEAHLADSPNQPEDLGRWTIRDLSEAEIVQILAAEGRATTGQNPAATG